MLLAGVPLIPELFLDYQQEEIRDKNALVTSGLMVTNAAIQAEFAKGGKTIDLPFYGDLTGDSEIDSDTVASTPTDIAGDLQVGVRNMRRKSWKSSDLAADLSGSDPAQAIARSTGRYWIRDMQVVTRNILNGLFNTGGPLAVSHTVGGATTQLSPGLMVDGIAKLGDAGDELTGVMMHSAVYYALMKLDLIVPASTTSTLVCLLKRWRKALTTVARCLLMTACLLKQLVAAPAAVVLPTCPSIRPSSSALALLLMQLLLPRPLLRLIGTSSWALIF